MSGDEDHERGRTPRERSADEMIEQRPLPERRKASAALDEARLRQQAIGVRLRQMFDEVVNEEVPAEFLEILRRADERGSGKS
ncbi:NepR family anti-sigma factor [Phenylobacterium sp.]|uniref:anti-sigma T factor NepR n=1 Tax=Phenylobacterium sp. TaxID=1871053 RepID=UPI003D2C53D4